MTTDIHPSYAAGLEAIREWNALTGAERAAIIEPGLMRRAAEACARVEARRPRGFAAYDDNHGIIGSFCPECAEIDHLADTLTDEYGNELVRLFAPFECEACGEEC